MFVALTWPLAAIAEVLTNARNLSRPGLPGSLRMLGFALLGNVPPVEFIAYGFEDRARRKLWRDYLYWTDTDAVKRLNRLRGADNDDVQNKVRFADLCGAHGLAHAPAVAELRAGEVTRSPNSTAIPAGDLWLKPKRLQGGIGAELWRAAKGVYTGPDGTVFTFEALLARAASSDGLLQPRLRNHADIEPFTNGSLASLRIVTACHRGGTVSLLGNYLVLPQGDALTSAGGMVCRVSWEGGVVHKVLYAQREEAAAAVLSARLPFWNQSLELVSQAHRTAFPLFATLGWDVVLTDQGPLLLEANSGWGALAMQQLWGPVGLTPFTALLEEESAAER